MLGSAKPRLLRNPNTDLVLAGVYLDDVMPGVALHHLAMPSGNVGRCYVLDSCSANLFGDNVYTDYGTVPARGYLWTHGPMDPLYQHTNGLANSYCWALQSPEI